MYDEDSKLGWELTDDGTWNMWSYFRGVYIDYGMTPYDYGWTGPEEGNATTMQKKPSTLADYYMYDYSTDSIWRFEEQY